MAAAAGAPAAAAGGGGHGSASPSDAVCFILVAFSLGIFLRLCMRWSRVPYTAMLLLGGLGIGFLQLAHPPTLAFTNTLHLWLSMEPHLLLLVFLPIIGFSAAINCEPHMLRKSWLQIMLLAWPGVVVQCLLIGGAAYYFFPYGWSWPKALLFGAMLSATDPVAVVAVLQEVGASPKLACVIDGESLMNDGSALVIFLLLQRIVEGEAVSVGGAVAQFCLLALAGMALGGAYGLATSWLLESIFRDGTLTTIVTLVSAYASYYTADRLVGASGLLAVVCNGFTMCLVGGRDLALRAEASMHGFWSVLEWGANTLLFVWMGIVLSIVLPPSHEATALTDQPIHLVPSDAGYALALYLWLQVCRGVLLLVCWLPFNYTGYPLTWRSGAVMVWSGLRGAVGMAMSLFVFLDDKIHDGPFRSYCVFYMGVSALATVLINGGTAKALLTWLGFLSYSPEQLATLGHVIDDMEDMRRRRLASLANDEVLGEPDVDAVAAWSKLPTEALLGQAAARTVRPPLPHGSTAVAAALAAGLDPQLLYDLRCRLLNMTKAHYADVYEAHLLSTLQVRTLQAVADAALDEAGEGLADWRLLCPSVGEHGLPRLARLLRLHRLSSTGMQVASYRQALSALGLLVGFIRGHRAAQEQLRSHVQAEATTEEAADGPQHDSKPHSGANVMDAPRNCTSDGAWDGGGTEAVLPRSGAEALAVLKESEDAVSAALAAAEAITVAHPSLPAWLHSRQAASEVLAEQHTFLQRLADAGLLAPRELLLLGDMLHERARDLLRASGAAAALAYGATRPPANALPLLDALSDEQAAALMSGNDGAAKVIACLGDPLTEVVLIAKGAVRMDFPAIVAAPAGDAGAAAGVDAHTAVASVGDALGVAELLLGVPRLARLTADSVVQALHLPGATLLALAAQHPGVATRAWQATAATLAAQHHHILGRHRQLAPLNVFFRACAAEAAERGAAVSVPRTALLLTGRVQAVSPLPAGYAASQRQAGNGGKGGGEDAGVMLAAPAELPPGHYVAQARCMLLQVPRGPELPGPQQTAAFQAQLIGRGAAMAASGGSDRSADGCGPVGPGGTGASSLRGVIARASRLAKLSRTPSDTVPQMPFLQRALAGMREQRDGRIAAHCGTLSTSTLRALESVVEAGSDGPVGCGVHCARSASSRRHPKPAGGTLPAATGALLAVRRGSFSRACSAGLNAAADGGASATSAGGQLPVLLPAVPPTEIGRVSLSRRSGSSLA